MPVHGGTDILTYHRDNKDAEPPASTAIENERRLFYVALTRAKKQVCIGTVEVPRLGVQLNSSIAVSSRFLEEMRLETTAEITNGLTGCVDQQSVAQFIAQTKMTYQRDRTLGGAVRNIAERYLPDLAYPRAAERVGLLLQDSSPSEFKYAREYVEIGTHAKQSPPAKMHLPPVVVTVAPEDPDFEYE